MLILKLAYRNLKGAGLRTWLNVLVLSLALVVIIWVKGFLEGMNEYAKDAKTEFEIGGGQFWHAAYDPYDPFTLEDSHAPLSPALQALVSRGDAVPILMTAGAFFPEGRAQSVLLKGIDPAQTILNLPTSYLENGDSDVTPALIGAQMARQTKLAVGDYVTIRWRDVNGTFDADDIRIVQIMNTTLPTVEQGQIWLPIGKLRDMLQAPGEASIVVLKRDIETVPPGNDTWIHRDPDYLLKDIADMIKMKSSSVNVIYGLLLFMGLLAIFDTQVLSIWRRRKEIGTIMALGMERGTVIGLFTFEGAMHGLLALAIGAVYGIPVLLLSEKYGLPMPEMAQDFGIAIPPTLYPVYGLQLVAGTTLLVLVTVTIVSYLPASKIAKLKPTDALRGKQT
jgi:putative ABC transport system permease protein